MSPAVQEASIAAWADEAHVIDNRRMYREKFETVVPMLSPTFAVAMPQAGFYLWMRIPARWGDDDERFTRDLLEATNITVLPGRYLGRDAHGVNPGAGHVRIALVPPLDECIEAARRMLAYCH
jgi:N-succinyldiaminopimelate aminotransferase